jgi:outer membrane assembly lipoprotein YfiO
MQARLFGMSKAGVAIGLFLCGLLVGCSAPKKPAVIELKPTTLSAIDGSEEKLFQTAQRLYEQEIYSVARDYFQSLKDRYPTGAYAELAEIKIAETFSQTRDHETAVSMFEEFARNHPSSQSVPYALAMAGRSTQLMFGGIGRDITPVERAVAKYDEFLARFPDSSLRSEVQRFRLEAIRTIALAEQSIANYYQRRQKPMAVAARQEYVAKNLTPILAPPTESAMASLNLAEISRASLPKVLHASRVSQLPNNSADVRAAVVQQTRRAKQLSFVRRIECKESDFKQVYLYFNENAGDLSALPVNAGLKPQNGIITVDLKGDYFKPESVDCFGLGDLTVAGDGRVTLKTSSSVDLMVVSNPSRLLMVLND